MEYKCSPDGVRLYSMSMPRDRSLKILAFIRNRVEADGRPPTLGEIADACGFKSRSAVQKHVRALEASGELQVTPGRARSALPTRAKEQAAGANAFFVVTAVDIQDLTDVDLRALVARLCAAGLADAGLPSTCVIWGGDQRAPDGGIDVRVKTQASPRLPAPLNRGTVGIQVKATRMPMNQIQREMCPGGILRPSILELIRADGAYVIAASDLVADEEYQRRIEAMRSAAALPEASDAIVDYYDARRLADWTNQHPGVVAWVRSRLGRPLQGWQPYASWSNPAGDYSAFFADKKLRIADPLGPDEKISLVDGLHQVRRILRTGGHSVRLTGLSGVGKTRFVQALFEHSAAPNALAAELAIYTDTAASPVPPPTAVLDELLAARRQAIVIVDNCSSKLHNQLSERCKTSDRVSLLTIEYDIREELASETNVFRLDAGSDELIESVLEQRFPYISQVNQRTISRFADGNSRVAIALAQTMERHDSLAGLNDNELFDRLFWLGKEVDQELKVAAEVCSLVYSFDVEDTEGELAQLGALADCKPLALYRHVADFEERGLAQRRGSWRAILPHAIANRLAARALGSIPLRLIEKHLVSGQGRLWQSFSRRLGYLHKSPRAVELARSWLASDGLLGDLSDLTGLQEQVLANIAPLDPASTLEAIKRAIDGPQGEQILASRSSLRLRQVELLRLIAFEPDFFDTCIELLIRFALAEAAESRSNSTRSVIKSLFQIYLSGTHASTVQRARWVRALLGSSTADIRDIGLDALSTALECHHLSSHYGFEFGARVRDFGAYPRGGDAREWFATFIGVAVDLATSGGPMAEGVRDVLGKQFRALWTMARVLDPLEAATAALLPGGWERGWLAIRQTLSFDGKNGMSEESHARLSRLETFARPSTLVGQVKAVVLHSHFAGIDCGDGESPANGYQRADHRARQLGELVAVDEAAFAEIAPLVVANVQGRQGCFGEGLAATTPSLEGCWAELVSALEALPPEDRNVQVLRGFLSATSERDRNLFNQILDECMIRPTLAQWAPILQLSAVLDERGCDRLLSSMNDPNVPAWVFRHLAYGGATDPVPEPRLAQMLERLGIKPGGLAISIEILHMHIYGEFKPLGQELAACARRLIANAPLERHDQGLDHALGELVKRFLVGAVAENAAHQLLERIRKGIDEYTISRYDFSETLRALFSAQPILALEALIGDSDQDEDESAGLVRHGALAGGRRTGALLSVPEDALLGWCRAGAGSERWVRVAPVLPAFEAAADDAQLKWSSGVRALLTHAPDPVAVAKALLDVLAPMSWSGSRAEVMRERLPLLDQLAEILGSNHAGEVAAWRRRAMDNIEREARRELEEHRLRDERFE